MWRLFGSRFHTPEDYADNEQDLTDILSVVTRHVDHKLGHCRPGLDWRHIAEHGKDHSDLKDFWRFENLVGAMYLQMWWLMVSKGDVARCKNRMCGRVISLAPPKAGERKLRNDKEFCNDACRQQHRYHTKVKPDRLRDTPE